MLGGDRKWTPLQLSVEAEVVEPCGGKLLVRSRVMCEMVGGVQGSC
jgi:hypothetical protein